MAYKDPSTGQWVSDLRLNGRRRTKRFPPGTQEATVKQYEAMLRLGAIDPRLRPSDTATFADFAREWLKRCQLEKGPSTYRKCAQIVAQHLIPKFGSIKITAITSVDVDDLQLALRKREYAVQSINNVLGVLSMIFKDGIRRGKCMMNPVAGIKRLRRPQKDYLIWSQDEKDRFLVHVRDANAGLFRVCAFALMSGLRPMEIRGLLREDIDFDQGMVIVRRQWCSKQNMLVNYTKTREVRTVPLPRVVLQMLADMRGAPMGTQIFPEVTSNSFGHRILKPLMRAAGVREVRFHDFRHIFATHCLMSGLDVVQVQKLLGHKKLESTSVYLHLVPGHLKGATDRLAEGSAWVFAPKSDNVVKMR